MVFLSFSFILTYPLLLENFVILFGLFVYTNLTSFLAQFFDLEDQLAIQSLGRVSKDNNWSIIVRKGLIFDEVMVKYESSLGFFHQADKRNLFDIIKNNNGFVTINNHSSVKIFFRTLNFKLFPINKNKIFFSVNDIDNIIHNLLIDS